MDAAAAPADDAGVQGARPSHPSVLGARGRRRTWLLIAAIVGVVAALAALLGFGLTRDPDRIASPLVGHQAPEFSLRTLDGSRTVALRDLRGHVVVVNFWASWCDPCREEAPDLGAAWDRYRDRGVVVLGVLFNDSAEAGKRFVTREAIRWPVVQDPGDRTALDFGVYGVPETYFIAPDGKVAAKVTGRVSYATLTEDISALLEQGRA